MDIFEYTGVDVIDAAICGTWDDNIAKACWKQTGKRESATKYYGANYQIGSSPEFSSNDPYEPKGVKGEAYDKDSVNVYYESKPYHTYQNYYWGGQWKI